MTAVSERSERRHAVACAPWPLGSVRAAAVVEAQAGARGTELARLRSEPPLVLRRTGPASVHLVSVGAGPLGGDDLAVRVHVGNGARLRLAQVAACVALPGRAAGAASSLRWHVTLGEGAVLRWDGEPTVAAAGAVHRAELTVVAAAGASLSWREQVVCGRAGEPSGIVHSRLHVVREGVTVLRADTTVGDALWASPAVGGGARVAATCLLLGVAAEAATPHAGEQVAVLRPEAGVALVTALGEDHPGVSRALQDHTPPW